MIANVCVEIQDQASKSPPPKADITPTSSPKQKEREFNAEQEETIKVGEEVDALQIITVVSPLQHSPSRSAVTITNSETMDIRSLL